MQRATATCELGVHLQVMQACRSQAKTTSGAAAPSAANFSGTGYSSQQRIAEKNCKGGKVGCRMGAHLLHGFSSEHTKDDRHARVLASPQQASSSSIGNSLIMCGGAPHL